MCELQLSPLPNEQDVVAILGLLSLQLESPPDDNPDLSVSQEIHTGIAAFRVDDEETPTKKTHPKVKEVSRKYLYRYHYFVQCIWVVLL